MMLDTFEFPQGTSGISENIILKKTLRGYLIIKLHNKQ